LHACRSIWEWKENKSSHSKEKKTSGGLAICLSACEDSQVAADTAVRIFLYTFSSLSSDEIKINLDLHIQFY